jgi:hypothetical protein
MTPAEFVDHRLYRAHPSPFSEGRPYIFHLLAQDAKVSGNIVDLLNVALHFLRVKA